MPLVFLIDTSSAMTGEPINNLNKALRDFIEQAQVDERSANRLDVAIIEFNSEVRVVQDFTPVSKMKPITLIAGGVTSTGNAINLTIDKLRERRRFYGETGTLYYHPWIVMITASCPTDDITEAAQLIKTAEAKGTYGEFKFWTVGVPGFSLEHVEKLSDTKRILKYKNFNFDELFGFFGSALVYPTCVYVKLDALPEDGVPVRKNELPPEWEW